MVGGIRNCSENITGVWRKTFEGGAKISPFIGGGHTDLANIPMGAPRFWPILIIKNLKWVK